MSHIHRVGVSIPHNNDWYWDQVLAGLHDQAQQHQIQLVSLDAVNVGISTLPGEEHVTWLEQQEMYGLDALIYAGISSPAWYRILHHNFPIISLTETTLQHPLLITPHGLDKIAFHTGNFIAQQLQGKGSVLVIGGLMDIGEAGRSRLAGLCHALQTYPDIQFQHVPCLWGYGHGYTQAYPVLLQHATPLDAIVGLIDALALAARDAAQTLSLLHERTLVVGFEGTPLALSAIKDGSMHATVDLYARQLGQQAVKMAWQAIQRQIQSNRIPYQSRLITAESLAADIQPEPDLLSIPQANPGQRLLNKQDIDRVINSLNGTTLDRYLLLYGISNLIRSHYHYDHVQIFRWFADRQVLCLETGVQSHQPTYIPLKDANVLKLAIHLHGPIFIADTQKYEAFPPDPRWPQIRTRIIIPITLHTGIRLSSEHHPLPFLHAEYERSGSALHAAQGDTLIGLLDLHCHQVHQPTFEDFGELEKIAVRLGLSMRSADLYTEAQQARVAAQEAQARAEQADQLKTRLLANVSHELRTPLHALLNHTKTALASTHYTHDERPSPIKHNLEHIASNVRHLSRLINDLLDLSRAEVDELTLVPEFIPTHTFLLDVFYNLAPHHQAQTRVQWKIQLPPRLPALEADPVRLRQILFNLLDNARKFTEHGSILLGAEVVQTQIHLWVADTGVGIPTALQERIFEPFVTGENAQRRQDGVGLGLSITRRLVALHGGTMQLESTVTQGSTFHLYLPLPAKALSPTLPSLHTKPVLLLVSPQQVPSEDVLALCHRQQMMVYHVHEDDDLDLVWSQLTPQAIAWDNHQVTAIDWQLIERVRKHPRFHDLPLLLISQEGQASNTGITNILLKPVPQHTLTTMLETLRPATTKGVVFIVDDDTQTCEIYAQLVQQCLPGYTCTTAHSGLVALHRLKELTPDIIILDLVMPEVDGFVVLEYVRTNARTRQIPVLVLSGRALASEDVQRLNHMNVSFQSKELLSHDELTHIFQRLLNSSPLTPQTSILVKHYIAYVHHHYTEHLTRREIALAVGVSERHLARILQQELNMSPMEYLTRYRLKQAQDLLKQSTMDIQTIAHLVGFDDASYFGRIFRQRLGCSPSEYRKK